MIRLIERVRPMLETIKRCISEELEGTDTFPQFFTSYVIHVQDKCIDQELAYMLNHNIVDVELIDRAIADAFKGLIEDDL